MAASIKTNNGGDKMIEKYERIDFNVIEITGIEIIDTKEVDPWQNL